MHICIHTTYQQHPVESVVPTSDQISLALVLIPSPHNLIGINCSFSNISLLSPYFLHPPLPFLFLLPPPPPLSSPHLYIPQEQLPDKPFTNMTTDWNDGTLVASLVDSIAPGLCPEASTMEPQNALENASHAMKLAEDWLGIPQVCV